MSASANSTVLARVPWFKGASILAWGIGALFTSLFIAQLVPGITALSTYIIAGALQILLTFAERPLWRLIMRRDNGRLVSVAIAATIVDALFNAAGIYPYIPRIAQTDVGRMLISAFHLAPDIGPTIAFLLAGAIGTFAASLSEALWETQ